MSAASWVLQQAIYATLSTNADILDVLGDPPRLYDAVPHDAAFPYAVIGDDSETDASTKTETGSHHTAAIHIWSRAGGHREAKTIAHAVRDVLDGADLDLSPFTLVGIRYQAADFSRVTDGGTWRASLRFRAVIDQN
jgi:hypothetical protein